MRDSMAPGDEAPADRNETAPNTCPDRGGSGRRDRAELRQAVGGA